MVPNKTKRIIKYNIGWPVAYQFSAAQSIQLQSMRFNFKNRPLLVEASRSIPLYETIQEIVDYDSYQIDKMTFDVDNNWIVDIGANIGVTTLVFSLLRGAQVISFEPFPSNVNALYANLYLNGISNVRVMPYAVFNKDGIVKFRPGEDIEGNAIDVCGHIAEGETDFSQHLVQVNSLCLESALAQVPNKQIKLIKMDCEGGEYEIVNQITPDIASHVENITLEVHDIDRRNNLKTISQRLIGLGYKLNYKADMFGRYNLHHILASRTL